MSERSLSLRGSVVRVTGTFRRHPYVTGMLLGLLTCAIIFAVHRSSPRTLVSAHGLLHVAVAQELHEVGSLFDAPPPNPFFAGERLPYYWFFHWIAARVAAFSGLNALLALEFLILVSVLVVWLSAVRLGRGLYGGLVPGLMIGLLAFAGANPLGAPLLGARVLRHGTKLLADDPDYLWGIVHPLMGKARLADPYSMYGPLINFFMNITSRPVALAFVLVMVLSLLLWLQKRRWWAWVLIMGSTGLSTALSPLIGGPAAAALGVSLLLVWWHRDRREPREERDHPEPQVVFLGFVALAVGGLLSLPTSYHLFGLAGGGGVEPGFEIRTLAAVIASSTLVVGMSLYATLRAHHARRFHLSVLTLAGSILLAVSIAIELPVSNHANFFHAAMFVLAVPAAGIFAPNGFSRSSRRLLAGVALLVFLPTPALVVYAYTDRPPIPLRTETAVLERAPTDGSLARFYAWVRSETAGDAVFVLDPGPPFITAVGNVPEFPALTGRDIFTAHGSSYVVSPYEDADRRLKLAFLLTEGRKIDPGGRAYLRELGRPIYLVLTETEGTETLEAVERHYGDPSFRNDGIAVFLLEPGPQSRMAGEERREGTRRSAVGSKSREPESAVDPAQQGGSRR